MEAEVQRKKESRGYKGRLGAKDGGAVMAAWVMEMKNVH